MKKIMKQEMKSNTENLFRVAACELGGALVLGGGVNIVSRIGIAIANYCSSPYMSIADAVHTGVNAIGWNAPLATIACISLTTTAAIVGLCAGEIVGKEINAD